MLHNTTTTQPISDYSQVPIIQCAYELALEAQRLVLAFPKNLRYQFGERLARLTQDLFENTIQANFTRDPTARWRMLDRLAAAVFTIRMLLRMAKDLKTISTGQYANATMRLEDYHKQLIGWTKWTQTKIARNDHQRPQDAEVNHA